ncbi:hypothetical protein Emin_0938 [Elusimicrobium minutum Pei191]|uniref:Uncharacterized protein n=1 Tax=Elusimicrobium minutum (strain Pei191) TaxID=445932 RepID=B2KD95_ELUMP|nr:hypothetical protein [Elusimicrobium minutum]ACC98491.1 hypothetical protein Emin_0938 [Elusimicrobium minutum Pei191]
MKYGIKILIALDQLANALMNGDPDITMSAACYYYARIGKQKSLWRLFLYKSVNMLFFWQEDHCYQAYLSEKDRLHASEQFR